MGATLPDDHYTEWTLDRPYYGVYYGYAALPMEPDRLTYLTSDLLDVCTVYNYETGSSLAPLLVPGYAKVTLADIRYLPSSQMGKYLTFTDQDVLFLYSAPVLNNSETLK